MLSLRVNIYSEIKIKYFWFGYVQIREKPFFRIAFISWNNGLRKFATIELQPFEETIPRCSKCLKGSTHFANSVLK